MTSVQPVTCKHCGFSRGRLYLNTETCDVVCLLCRPAADAVITRHVQRCDGERVCVYNTVPFLWLVPSVRPDGTPAITRRAIEPCTNQASVHWRRWAALDDNLAR